MRSYLYILFFIFMHSYLQAQADYQLSAFQINTDATIQGVHSSTKGLDIQFNLQPYLLDIATQHFSVELKIKEQVIATQTLDFTYTYSDSLAYLVDSLGMDSFDLDTSVHLYIPYRNIDTEEGIHDVSLLIWVKGQGLPVYNRPFRFHQVKIYDLFLDLKKATVIPDSTANPLGLGYNAPDPKWLVQVGSDLSLQGAKNRNAFKVKPKTFHTAITNYDSLSICVYNADATAYDYLGCFKIEHGNQAFTKNYQQAQTGRVKEASFDVKKIERKPVSTNFEVQENVVYKGIKGIQVNFEYSLPLAYKRRSIRIQVTDEKQAPFDNILAIVGERTVESNRILGTYRYFIAYYNLQNSERVKLKLTGNDHLIQAYESIDLKIKKTIETLEVQQTVGYQHEGISGILYQIDFNIPEIPTQAQLQLSFPSLSQKTIAQLFYWNAATPSKVQKGMDLKIPSINQQSIFIFLPYFVAPKAIELAPQLSIKTIDVPLIKLATFETEPYACPSGVNDIQIEATSQEEALFTGISGQLFQFNTHVPSYYHSKGLFKIQVLENGQALDKAFFINGAVNTALHFPIHNQQNIRVFIPYRIMLEGARYTVQLQAQGGDFTLSESRAEQYINQPHLVESVGIYLQELQSKDWDQMVYNISLRNSQNLNVTYPHLSYTTIVQDTVDKNYKPSIPMATHFSAALEDEIIIWIKSADQTDAQALRFSTSIAAMRAEEGFFNLKNQGALKKVIFKLIDKN
ncbi:MAG: Unknown protein [uncultured Aureispira sp.]|uniref:Uncharacterized protein n=1 Tax=uncultured Aureispira sp. TaxID=1331704 RepID=A0A6S6RTE9_9BACT|nr:MAG: Unknown protein [uncultured Aureispira sp.]